MTGISNKEDKQIETVERGAPHPGQLWKVILRWEIVSYKARWKMMRDVATDNGIPLLWKKAVKTLPYSYVATKNMLLTRSNKILLLNMKSKS